MSAVRGLPGPADAVTDRQRSLVLALAGLPRMYPPELRRLVGDGDLERSWALIGEGRSTGHEPARDIGDDADGGPRRPAITPAELRAARLRAAGGVDPEAVLAAHRAAGVEVAVLGEARFPALLAADPAPPALLCWRGDLGALDHRRVGIVGTRRCTSYGRRVAATLGADLAAAGVAVVSGLAAGIDGAGHRWVADGVDAAAEAAWAPPIAVVGSGLDVEYPRRHQRLWHEVARRGLLLSEAPLGTPPLPWRFPARNRIIAAVAEVLVVVESHLRGGSMLTVEAADRRGRTIMAVPGPVLCAASDGTNHLLAEGAEVCRGAADALVALGLTSAGAGGTLPVAAPPAAEPVAGADAAAQEAVLDALGWSPAAVDEIVDRSGLPLAEVSVALLRLQAAGTVVPSGTGLYDRSDRGPLRARGRGEGRR